MEYTEREIADAIHAATREMGYQELLAGVIADLFRRAKVPAEQIR